MKITRLGPALGGRVATDASYRHGLVAWAWVSEHGGWSLRVRQQPRILRSGLVSMAELAALYMALQHHDARSRSTPLTLHSDSETALDWGRRWLAGDVALPEFDHLGLWSRRCIGRLSVEPKPTTLVWVRGHDGHPLNEAADAIARLGTRMAVDQLTKAQVAERATGVAQAFAAADRQVR